MKKIIFIAIALITSLTIAAQTSDEATLTVTGSGENEEKATLVALRSAIEQTYGTFVSANTTILNDDLIKDEIVSISTGNIKNYKKLSSVALSNGQISVTLSATVSIGKLISYAESKGVKAEFSGAIFAMDVKLKKLRAKNTEKALNNLYLQIKSLGPLYDRKVVIGNNIELVKGNHILAPDFFTRLADNWFLVPIQFINSRNKNHNAAIQLLSNTLASLSLAPSDRDTYSNLGIFFDFNSGYDGYESEDGRRKITTHIYNGQKYSLAIDFELGLAFQKKILSMFDIEPIPHKIKDIKTEQTYSIRVGNEAFLENINKKRKNRIPVRGYNGIHNCYIDVENQDFGWLGRCEEKGDPIIYLPIREDVIENFLGIEIVE